MKVLRVVKLKYEVFSKIQFYDLIEDGLLTLKSTGSNQPNIYKMGAVKKIKDCSIRKPLDLNMDISAMPLPIDGISEISTSALEDHVLESNRAGQEREQCRRDNS